MPIFDGSQREIGRGMRAVVYAFNGFAYKVYEDSYPREWVAYEIKIQEEICKTSLPVVRYWKTEEPHIIRMERIDGIQLADRIRKEKYKQGVEDLIALQKQIHRETADVPRFNPSALHKLEQSPLEEHKKEAAIDFLEKIPEGDQLLHLDFHFSNILYAQPAYWIIDWVDAKLGNPIFDVARSYVIMNQFALRLSGKYLRLAAKEHQFDPAELNRAVYIAALLRDMENRSDRTTGLLRQLEAELFT